MLFFNLSVYSQCPNGSTSGGVAFDTTVLTGSGNYSTQFSFPKIDPQNGMVTCVKLFLTITGRVSMFLENNVSSSAICNINYKRKDTLTSPALRYEVKVSNNGYHFSSFGRLTKKTGSDNNIYTFNYMSVGNNPGMLFFRIKRIYSNGYTRFSDIRSIEMENSKFPKISIYPNPSNGIVGIKFDDNRSGQMDIRIFNAQGKIMANNHVTKRSLLVELTDVTSQLSCVNQLFIK